MQHPVITNIQRFGYPEQEKVAHQCSECGEPIYVGEDAYELSFGWVCKDCMENAFRADVE